MKTTRQRAILSLIATRPVHSQEELAHFLEQQGYEVTQATVSRDIKDLGLVKVPLKNGNGSGTQFKYVEPGLGKGYASRLHRVIAELVRDCRGSGLAGNHGHARRRRYGTRTARRSGEIAGRQTTL